MVKCHLFGHGSYSSLPDAHRLVNTGVAGREGRSGRGRKKGMKEGCPQFETIKWAIKGRNDAHTLKLLGGQSKEGRMPTL